MIDTDSLKRTEKHHAGEHVEPQPSLVIIGQPVGQYSLALARMAHLEAGLPRSVRRVARLYGPEATRIAAIRPRCQKFTRLDFTFDVRRRILYA